MDLKDFVKNTILSINEGVREASSGTEKTIEVKASEGIKFNVAITAVDESGKSGGGSIKVPFLQSIGLEAQATVASSNTSFSHVEFTVTIY